MSTPARRTPAASPAPAAATPAAPVPAAPAAAEGLGALRERITALDEALLGVLAERQAVARSIAEAKQGGALPLRDVERERHLLSRHVQHARTLGLKAGFVTRIFQAVVDESLREQRAVLAPLPPATTVAVLGGEGSYSALAARAHFQGPAPVELVAGARFSDVVRSLRQGGADYAVLPIENSLTGGIPAAYDLLREGDLCVVGEHYLQPRHALVARPGLPLAQVERVLGHPQALAQCEAFLQGRQLPLAYCDSTADALRQVLEGARPGLAAVAGPEVAAEHGLAVLAADIANSADNETRFLVLARAPREVPLTVPCKSTLLFSTWQRPGALADVLRAFRDAGVNLTRIESRPTPGQAWQELFFVDLDGNVREGRVAAALQEAARSTRTLRVLGCYPSDRLPPTDVPAEVLAQGAAAAGHLTAGHLTAGPTPTAPAPAVPGAEAPAGEAPATSRGWARASRAHRREDTVVQVGGVRLGAGFVVVAGAGADVEPCAAWAAEHGARLLRGGPFAPRGGAPLAGPGPAELALLGAAGARHGLPLLVEVAAAADVGPVSAGADLLQVGARRMGDAALLEAVGRAHRPVVLERGAGASLEEWLEAADRILAAGNQQVVLCERGGPPRGAAPGGAPDLGAVAVLRELTHLPVLVDLSSAARAPERLVPLARAARAVGAHGVVVDLHPGAGPAPADAPHALGPAGFARLMRELYGAGGGC
jgi:chorismate mutase/prephenate dehydratase